MKTAHERKGLRDAFLGVPLSNPVAFFYAFRWLTWVLALVARGLTNRQKMVQ